MNQDAINERYSSLSESSCCLSCGGAINLAEPAPGEICADLGCGRGNDVMRLAEAVGAEGFVYGIDLSEGMIAKAKSNLQKFDVKNAEIRYSELEYLTLKSQSIDLVISNCTINHSPDKQRVWKEIYRVLKHGGRFVVSDIFAVQPIPKAFKNNPEAVAECWAGAVTQTEYLESLILAGFDDIRILESSEPYKKGEAEVCSFTVSGKKRKACCCS
jgi:arsenite methyltransferase